MARPGWGGGSVGTLEVQYLESRPPAARSLSIMDSTYSSFRFVLLLLPLPLFDDLLIVIDDISVLDYFFKFFYFVFISSKSDDIITISLMKKMNINKIKQGLFFEN